MMRIGEIIHLLKLTLNLTGTSDFTTTFPFRNVVAPLFNGLGKNVSVYILICWRYFNVFFAMKGIF